MLTKHAHDNLLRALNFTGTPTQMALAAGLVDTFVCWGPTPGYRLTDKGAAAFGRTKGDCLAEADLSALMVDR